VFTKTDKIPKSSEPLAASYLCRQFSLPQKPKSKGAHGEDKGSGGLKLIGQERALQAIRFAAQTPHSNFNLFVTGQQGFGRHRAVLDILTKEALGKPAPQDWVYVHNFTNPHKPVAISLPSGMAIRFKDAMQTLIDDLANEIPALFEADAYQSKRRALEQEFGEQHEKAFEQLMSDAHDKNLALLRTPMGFMVAATINDQPMKPEDFEALPKKQQALIDKNIRETQDLLEVLLKQIPKREKTHRHSIENLNSTVANEGVENAIKEVNGEFRQIEKLKQYLDDVKADLIENAEQFLTSGPGAHAGAFPVATTKHYSRPEYQRYSVNIMVSNPPQGHSGAPVVTENLPTLANLVGRIEHMSEMGAIFTDFTMIHPGALHRANSGYLVLDVLQILSEPFAWDALKRCLKTKQISIVSAQERLSLFSTTSLEPDPIPLDIRVALVGERIHYYLLSMYDPDFLKLFKIQADFNDEVPITPANIADFAEMGQLIAQKDKLLPLNKSACERLLIEATRMAEDAERLSLNAGKLSDIIREANHLAKIAKASSIDASTIEEAIENAEYRSSRQRELTQEAIERNILLVETSGSAIGQINALSVHQIGEFRFGRPSRVTARVRAGKGEVVDIEREVELGGPLHSKGVMILSAYLSSQYALDVPLSLWASIVFEQSYGGVDGDSASAAELFSVLSALSECPINQSFAVTGSVNQLGEIQTIGGVNEKIEGFFDICDHRGLTGQQGVLIPYSNIKHLALRPRVVKAAKAKKFKIIPIKTINEGISLLTGNTAGKRLETGSYSKNSINDLVEKKLISFADRIRSYSRAVEPVPSANGSKNGKR